METALLPLELRTIEKLREQELEEARVIQNVMLPAHPLRTAGVTISHEFQPVAEVGGDYLDYFSLSDGCVGLYIGDVSGKGLPAALYAALAVGTLRGVHKTGQEPARVLVTLNERLLLRGIPGRHTAIQYAVFDPWSARMRIVSAGMPGPILLRGSDSTVLQIAGLPPGLFSLATYDEFTLQLEPGDSVLFCTDGLTDARNLHEEEFGIDGIRDVCRRHAGETPLDLLGQLFRAIQKFSANCKQWDDMTAAFFHFAG
ncbi:MAG TPA: SpoIIE family protein phosphatase [Candidatus Eisenbacteria bacterium]|nr:SpoIIE family protein phosphatase [Candidatus Eisenbacteria bacterium]